MERGKGRAGSLSLRDSDKGRTLSTRQGQLLAEAARNFPGFSGPLKAVYFQHLGYVSISPQGRASDHLVLLSLSVLHPKKRSFKIPANKTRRRARERVPWATTTEGDEADLPPTLPPGQSDPGPGPHPCPASDTAACRSVPPTGHVTSLQLDRLWSLENPQCRVLRQILHLMEPFV